MNEQKYLLKNIFYKSLRLFLFFLGISFFFWAYFEPRFRDIEGFLTGQFCLPFAVGLTLIILGLAVTGRFKRFAGWFSLAFVGQAVALQMINAGPLIRYQHYKPFDHLLTGTHPLLLIYLAIQTAAVVAGLWKQWPKIWIWVSKAFKTWQLLVIGLIFSLSSAAVQRDIPLYLGDLFIATLVQTVNLGNIVLMVWALPEETLASLQQKIDRFLGQPGVGSRESIIRNPWPVQCEANFTGPQSATRNPKEKLSGLDRFAMLAAIWVVILAIVLNFFSYQKHPHVPDEVLYLYHARYLANGMLTVPAPPVPEAFSFYMIPHEAGRWHSIFPPGWPAVLAIGIAFGVPWIVNPLLAGLNILLIYILIQETHSCRTARMVVLLLCFSPWYIFMSMNFMSHTFILTCALAASVAISRARRTGKVIWGWLSGIMTGMVSLVRPLDGVIVASLLGLWVFGVVGRRLKISSIAAFLVGAIAISAVLLPYNKQITGDATLSPLTAYYEKYYGPKVNAFGFGPERGLGWAIDPFPGHSPLESLINANLNTFMVNVELFGWSTGSLIIIALLVFSGAIQRKDYLMLAVIIAIFGAYSLYWFSGGPDFGARYWYLMIIPLVVLTVRGIHYIEDKIDFRHTNIKNNGTRIMVAVLSLCFFSVVNFFPWRAADKYHHYRGMRPDIRYLAKEHGFGKSLILVRGNSESDYMSAWIYNPLDPYADATVYVWDRNPEIQAKILEAYSDRQVWIVNGPTITHKGYDLAEGPVSALGLLAKEKMNPQSVH